MRIKKNDQVIILSGKERGMVGRVMRVLPDANKVVVENRNVVQRHTKRGPQGQEGGILPKEAAIDASNVALYSEQVRRGVRVRARFEGAGGTLFPTRKAAIDSFGDNPPAKVRKVRFAPKTGEVFD